MESHSANVTIKAVQHKMAYEVHNDLDVSVLIIMCTMGMGRKG